MSATPPTTPPARITEKQRKFCRLVLTGMTNAESWRVAYNKPGSKAAAERAKEVMETPGVQYLLAKARAQSERKTLLTVNDRLAICAEIAQDAFCKPSDRVMGVRVYNETAGDHAPERQEVTLKSDPNAPLMVVTRPATKQEKIAALKAQREAASIPQPATTAA